MTFTIKGLFGKVMQSFINERHDENNSNVMEQREVKDGSCNINFS